ncbi:MAG: energy transducer TonB [bacterium]
MKNIKAILSNSDLLTLSLLGVLALIWCVKLTMPMLSSNTSGEIMSYPMTGIDVKAKTVTVAKTSPMIMGNALPKAAINTLVPTKVQAVAATRPVVEDKVVALPLVAPSIISQPAPIYPLMARESGVSGTVMLSLLISANGDVSEVKMLSTSGSQVLDGSAISAVYTWKFNPAKQGNNAVSSWYTMPVSFNLINP